MNCPFCGTPYEQIFVMGQVAPVTSIPGCTCPPQSVTFTTTTSVPQIGAAGYQWNVVGGRGSAGGSGLTTQPEPPVIVPEEPLQPAEEIVSDLCDLLDELDED